MNFWDETHPLSAESKRLTEQLMTAQIKTGAKNGASIPKEF